MKPIRIVLDTNILLVSISTRSSFHWIIEYLFKGKYELCVTTEILAEYEEIISRHMGVTVATAALDALLELPNIKLITRYYKWDLLVEDPDDNKFVDCTVAARAHYLVSHDKHFKALAYINFPKLEVIDAKKFKDILDIT